MNITLLIILILSSSTYILKIYRLYYNEKLWKSIKCKDKNLLEDKEEEKRISKRSIYLSLFTVINLFIFSLLGSLKIPKEILLKTYTFFMDPIIGFFVSNIYLTEDALAIKEKKVLNVRYFLGMLGTGTFYRYLILVFIDIFFSMLMIDKIKRFELINNFSEDMKPFIEYFIIVCIKVLTFFVYVQKIQINWVFTNKKNKYINTTLIRFILLIAGLLFLDNSESKFDILTFVSSLVIFISGSEFDLFSLNPNIESKKIKEKEKILKKDKSIIISDKWKNGLINLLVILVYGILIPVLFNGMEKNKKINIIIVTVIIIISIIYKLYVEASKKLEIKDEKKIC